MEILQNNFTFCFAASGSSTKDQLEKEKTFESLDLLSILK